MLDQLRQFIGSLAAGIGPATVVDIALTALLIYWFFVLIQGTRALRLVFGVIILYFVYVAAQFFGLQLLSQILQTGAVIGLFAIVVVFQPEIRRALDRIGRMGTLRWFAPTPTGVVERVSGVIGEAVGSLAASGHGALIVIERHTPLGDIAETGVALHADVSSELLRTIFQPKGELHDRAVIVRGETILAAGALLPMPETMAAGRRGTRHRAAQGITEQTDAIAVVVSEESGAISVAERGRIERVPDADRLVKRLIELLTEGRPISAWVPLRLDSIQPPQALRQPLRRRGVEPQAQRR
jgi:diadenylate cyclase